MAECNSFEHDFHEIPNMYSDLNAIPRSNQQHFRLSKINKIKDYFVAEIKERINELFFDYFDKSLITTGSISMASFSTVPATPVRIISASL